jgi:uncharacterized protein (TIGR03066 family)
LVAGAAAAAPADDPADKAAAQKLVGTWRLTAHSKATGEEMAARTVTVEFTRDGKMVVRHVPKPKDNGAAPIVLKGTYKLAKGKIDYTIGDGQGLERGEVLTIDKLTDEVLATTDPEGIKEEFKKVRKGGEQGKADEKKPKPR